MPLDYVVRDSRGNRGAEYFIDGGVHTLTGALAHLRSRGFSGIEAVSYIRLLQDDHQAAREDDQKYRVFMRPLPGINEGWYGGTHSTNAPLYNRVPLKSQAELFSKSDAVASITSFRSKGYPCYAEPPITAEY